MPLTQKKKKARRKFRTWRAIHNSRFCVKCGKELFDTVHHFHCNSCHAKRKQFDKEIRDAERMRHL